MIRTLRAAFATESPSYGWIIDKDHRSCQLLTDRSTGVRGPRGISDDIAAELSSRRKGRLFHLYREDTPFFSGRLLSRDGAGTLAPLAEYGEAFGCTRIEYRDD